MSATNLTKNLKLPQFVASDKPSWLGDFNGAMKNIDDGVGVIKGDITKASDTASSAKSQSDANTVTLGNVNTELENQGNRITALEAGGGTEQLEQRVNTLGTDVEALQTRADTFEEEIAENGKSITTLKGRVDAIEPKVKTNADNITSLQTSNTTILSEIQSLHETNTEQGKAISSAQTMASTAKNTADESKSIATLANTTANNANKAINTLKQTASNLGKGALTLSTSYLTDSLDLVYFYNNSTITFLPLLVSSVSIPTNYTAVATFSLPSIVNSIIGGTGESYAEICLSGYASQYKWTSYVTVSGKTATIYLKSNNSSTSQISGVNFYISIPDLIYN